MTVTLDCKISGNTVSAIVKNDSARYAEGRLVCTWELDDGSEQTIETAYGVNANSSKECGSATLDSKPVKVLKKHLTPRP